MQHCIDKMENICFMENIIYLLFKWKKGDSCKERCYNAESEKYTKSKDIVDLTVIANLEASHS